ncbi:transferrin-like [Scaptodrosophila lebanonensis]|uniref:Transferrin-like n=1 Tax=Drosophila lebanonensis TaxID=7225 RepID=A0A6J2TNP6_DROLE|nr:transferrin-like [Scaptodrosophila lebanonensis]
MVALVHGRDPTFKLCTHGVTSKSKCDALVNTAVINSVSLNLACVGLETVTDCVDSVKRGRSNIVVLSGSEYKGAREEGLVPVLYARERPKNRYIAVAPANISLSELSEAQLDVDTNDDLALLSAIAYNNAQGREICSESVYTSDAPVIRILNSAKYDFTAGAESDILLCLNGGSKNVSQYQSCNVDADLQRAVFTSKRQNRPATAGQLKTLFTSIVRNFKGRSARGFDFFSTFKKVDDVIFKNSTVAFDLTPTYNNRIDEDQFNTLHCDRPEDPIDPLDVGDNLKEAQIRIELEQKGLVEIPQ